MREQQAARIAERFMARFPGRVQARHRHENWRAGRDDSMKAILRMTVPQGTANAHTAPARYQAVLEQFRAAFPATILTAPGALGQSVEEIEVKPLELQHFAWLRARRKEWTLHSFSYEERGNTERSDKRDGGRNGR